MKTFKRKEKVNMTLYKEVIIYFGEEKRVYENPILFGVNYKLRMLRIEIGDRIIVYNLDNILAYEFEEEKEDG